VIAEFRDVAAPHFDVLSKSPQRRTCCSASHVISAHLGAATTKAGDVHFRSQKNVGYLLERLRFPTR